MINIKKGKPKIEALAEKYIRKGKLREAIAEYQKLLVGNEQDIQVMNTLGDLYTKANQKDKAIEVFQKIADFYENKGLYYKAIAIYKRINRINPEDIESVMRLTDLLCNQGFVSEAKSEYLNLAKKLEKDNKVKDAIRIYERLLKLDTENIPARLTVAELYKKEDMNDKAIDELNEVAEYRIRHKEFNEAGEILSQARKLKSDHSRTLTNLLELFKIEDKKEKALELGEEILQRDRDNLKALYLLGNHYYESKVFKKAEEIFSRIISLRPKEVDARVKLGRIYVQKKLLDQAYEIYEPLVDTLTRKQKEEKAIGLLGLILSSKEIHLPTLKKLASIYKEKKQKENLEIVYKVILEEYRKNNLREDMFSILGDLVSTSPENEGYYYEYKELKKELGILDEEKEIDQLSAEADERDEIIDMNLAKADLYIEQGLIRNAKRILENLRIKFPDEPRINQKIEDLINLSPEVEEEEIPERVEMATEKETQLLGKSDEAVQEEAEEMKVTSADLFADTDIAPFSMGEEKMYFDLTERVNEELESIKAVLNFQLGEDSATDEKVLADIVTEFKKDLKEKVDQENYESHYNLGLAFMEQGLLDEAVEEYKLASKDQDLRAECYNLIGLCCQKNKDFQEAMKWIEKSIRLLKKKPTQLFALKYEQASLYEEMKEMKEALDLYREIKEWNDDYREVAAKIKKIERSLKRK